MNGRKLTLSLEDQSTRDGETRARPGGGGAADVSEVDARLLFDLAEVFENFGRGEQARAIDRLAERGVDEGYSGELCRLAVGVVHALDDLSFGGQRECFEALDIAVRIFRRVLELPGDHQRAYRNLALALMILGRERDAVLVCRDWVAELFAGPVEESVRRSATFVLGVVQIFSGGPVEAVFTFSRAMERNDEFVLFRFGLALALLKADRTEQFEVERVAVKWQDRVLYDVLERLRGCGGGTFGDFVCEMRSLGNGAYASLFKFQ